MTGALNQRVRSEGNAGGVSLGEVTKETAPEGRWLRFSYQDPHEGGEKKLSTRQGRVVHVTGVKAAEDLGRLVIMSVTKKDKVAEECYYGKFMRSVVMYNEKEGDRIRAEELRNLVSRQAAAAVRLKSE